MATGNPSNIATASPGSTTNWTTAPAGTTANEFGDFGYRPVPISAAVAVFLGLCGLFAFLFPFGVLIGLMALPIAVFAVYKIYDSRGELSGKGLAITGLLLSLISVIGGTAFHAVAFANEVPEGFKRVSFTEDIAKEVVITNGMVGVAPEVAALAGQKIFVKGYMYPTRDSENLRAFVFCRDSGDCCFGGQPKIEDMILVAMDEGKTADYSAGLVSVAGTFELRPEGGTNLDPIYQIKAVQVEPARTMF